MVMTLSHLSVKAFAPFLRLQISVSACRLFFLSPFPSYLLFLTALQGHLLFPSERFPRYMSTFPFQAPRMIVESSFVPRSKTVFQAEIIARDLVAP